MLDVYEATGLLYACLESQDGEGSWDIVVEVKVEVEYEAETYDCPASVDYKVLDYTVYYEGSGDKVSEAALKGCCFTLYRRVVHNYVLKSYATVEELLDKERGEIDWEQ